MNTHEDTLSELTWNGIDTPEMKSWLIGLLKDENVKNLCVTFTKKDGTERELCSTLVEERIPSDKRPKSEKASSPSDTALRVFDVVAQDWRSFRWDSIKKISFDML